LSINSKKFAVLEIKTDFKESKLIREKIWKSITSSINLQLDEDNSKSN